MYYGITQKRKDIIEIKNKIIGLKKEMLYRKTLNEQISNIDTMNSARSEYFNTSIYDKDTNMNTFRSDFSYSEFNFKLDTIKTNTSKSVRFDKDIENQNETESTDKLDYLTNKATNDRYKKLVDLVNKTKVKDNNSILNLSLPITPRSFDFSITTNMTEASKNFKSLESLNEQSNLEFIKE